MLNADLPRWKEGDRITWHHVPGRGRPASQVPGIVLKVTPLKVRIRVLIQADREMAFVVRTVMPETLTARSKPVPELDG